MTEKIVHLDPADVTRAGRLAVPHLSAIVNELGAAFPHISQELLVMVLAGAIVEVFRASGYSDAVPQILNEAWAASDPRFRWRLVEAKN
jgi:hypothetical protein